MGRFPDVEAKLEKARALTRRAAIQKAVDELYGANPDTSDVDRSLYGRYVWAGFHLTPEA